MAGRVVIIDTGILCVWLRVPGKETCGTKGDIWDYGRAEQEIRDAIKQNSTLVLPLATILETGNHIAQAPEHRLEKAKALAALILKAAQAESPWAAFTQQSELWSPVHLQTLAREWPDYAQTRLSIGDATIKAVADYYTQMGMQVRLLTADKQLSAHEPRVVLPVPRRRRT